MNKNIILMGILVAFIGSVHLQASQSDDFQLSINHEKAVFDLRSQSRNDEEILGITTAHTSAESLSTKASPCTSRSYSRNTYTTDEAYRNSTMVNSAFYSIATTNSAKVNAEFAKKVIISSPSLDTANLLADAMIMAARNNSPFVKNSEQILNDGSSKHELRTLTQDGLKAFHRIPSPESDRYINYLATEVRGLGSCNVFYKEKGLLEDKQKQLDDLCNQRAFIENCLTTKYSLMDNDY
jgi:hypothetical protein